MEATAAFGQPVTWTPERPRFRPVRLALSLAVGAIAVWVAAALVPDVSVGGVPGALLVAVLIAGLNALLPPLVAALRLPFTLALGFVLVLLVDAAILSLASRLTDDAIHGIGRAHV